MDCITEAGHWTACSETVGPSTNVTAAHRLANLMREAAAEHHLYEVAIGTPDKDWPTWYADYMLNTGKLKEIV